MARAEVSSKPAVPLDMPDPLRPNLGHADKVSKSKAGGLKHPPLFP